MNKLFFLLSDLIKKLWVRCCFFCVFALFAVVMGPVLGPFIPDELKKLVTTGATKNILQILASSMLAVTTFSLSIMVQAYSAAATSASPRANKLLMQNATSQNALGTFIGAFLFSIIGIIAIGANVYNEDIIIVLFVFTVIMIAVIVVMLLKWIDQLSRLGRVSDTISVVETALRKAIVQRAKSPSLGAKCLKEDSFNHEMLIPIAGRDIGYIQYIDIEMINDIAEKNNCEVAITHNPGGFLDSVEPIAHATKNISDEDKKRIANAFLVGSNRTFEQDPRYGFIVLSEIALRAMSPAVNDPGTAIEVMGSYVRTVRYWVDEFEKHADLPVRFKSVYVSPVQEEDIIEDMFSAAIFDMSKSTNAAMCVQRSLSSIQKIGSSKMTQACDYWFKYLHHSCESHLSQFECERIFQKTNNED